VALSAAVAGQDFTMRRRTGWSEFRRCGAGAILCALMLASGPLAALPEDLTELSLDDLMQIDVTSVSKRAEPLQEAAAAVYVLTAEDIRRSGARTLAEALRLVPGVHVARTSGQTYAISTGGFNSTSADKLEVLLDGRSVYTPLFSGVFWDVLDTYLPDVERIEVIRGPGATLWGANAVNGVINIVTRPSGETQGVEAIAGSGIPRGNFGGVRGGWALGEAGHLRAYAQARDDDNGVTRDGSESNEGLRQQQAGFRADVSGPGSDRYSLGGDAYQAKSEGETRIANPSTGTDFVTVYESDLSGANLHGQWERQMGPGSSWNIAGYFDHSEREAPTALLERRSTWDLSSEWRQTLGARHALILGAGYRNSRDETGGPPLALIFSPASRTLQTYSAFVQDQISLADGRGTLTLGTKFEHNDFTGVEFQPGVRLGWKLGDSAFTWAAVSRAVRTPNRLDSDVALFCPPPVGFPGICGPNATLRVGNPELAAENLLATEWGLRLWTARRTSLQLALFYNRYQDLRSSEPVPPLGAFDNGLHGRSIGGEIVFGWQPTDKLRFEAFYSHLDLDISADSSSLDVTTPVAIEDSNPRHMAGLRWLWSPAPRWTLDGFVRRVGELPNYEIPVYTELNLRLGWQLRRDLELALIGENLLDDHHPEFGPPGRGRVEVERQGILMLRWTPG
jgi:iron complex outermembrane receptor protein